MMPFSKIKILCVTAAVPLIIVGCDTSGSDVGVRSSAQPRVAIWRCSDAISSAVFSITISNLGSALSVADSRGGQTELRADPPGQRERYGADGYALVFAGRSLSWFAAGKRPADCKR